MAIDFPTSPSIGQKVTVSDLQYQWNGESWSIVTDKTILNNVVQSNDGNIDLSKGDYHKITIDENNLSVPIGFTNILPGSSRWTLEFNIQTPADVTYDLENASYDNESSGVLSPTPRDIHFKPDGTKLYVPDSTTDLESIKQYTLSTAWDLSTVSYDLQFVNVQDTTPNSVFFKPDGTRMYEVNDSLVWQYALTTAWDLSTAIYDNTNISLGGSPFFEDRLSGVFFKPDGTKMYVLSDDTEFVYQFTLSTAWDLGTASYDTVSFSVTSQDISPHGIFLKPDGTKMYIIGSNTGSVYQYTLSTAWDLSTASYDTVSFLISQEASSRGIFLKPDGAKMYIIGSGNKRVYQYSIGNLYDPSVSWSNTIIWDGNTAPAILKNQNLILEFYTPDGGTTIYGIEAINKDNT